MDKDITKSTSGEALKYFLFEKLNSLTKEIDADR